MRYPKLYALVICTSLALLSTADAACPVGYAELKTEHAGTGCVRGAPVPAPKPKPPKQTRYADYGQPSTVRVIDNIPESYDAQELIRSVDRISRGRAYKRIYWGWTTDP